MTPEHKKILRALVLELRSELEGHENNAGKWQPGDLERRLVELGVRRDREPARADELSRHADRDARATFDAYLDLRRKAALDTKIAEEEKRASQKRGRAKETKATTPALTTKEEAEVIHDAVVEFIRESAYTWANRLLALRCMEARGLIDEVVLQKETYGGKSLAHWRLVQKTPDAARGDDEGLFATLLSAFALHAERLPRLFHPAAPGLALRPTLAALRRCLALLSGTQRPRMADAAEDAIFSASDALGWAYQFWNIDTKERVFAAIRTKSAKIEGADIIPATQLYTEPYMVRFLVQNSLGATWAAMHPHTHLAERWDYFVGDADRPVMPPRRAADLTILDPACGSGHFLLAAQADLWDMYEEEGLFSGDPVGRARSILERNLFGLDIDERAVQIAEAALWMAAAEKIAEHGVALDERDADGRFPLSSVEMNLVATNIRLPGEGEQLEAFLKKHPDALPLRKALAEVFRGLAHVDELGSLVKIEGPVEDVLAKLQKEHEQTKAYGGTQTDYIRPALAQGALPLTVESYKVWKDRTLRRLEEHFTAEAVDDDLARRFFGQAAGKAVHVFDLLSRRYDVVVANPPYMGSKNMGKAVRDYIETHYEPGKRDLYAAFILRCLDLVRQGGRVALVAPQPWMFFGSYEQLRFLSADKLAKKSKRAGADLYRGVLALTTLETLVQLGRHAFDEADPPNNVALVVFAQREPADEHKVIAFRLHTARPASEQAKLLNLGIANALSAIRFSPLQWDLRAIPMAPLAFWLPPSLLKRFSGRTLGDVARIAVGLQTSEDARFVRFIWETPCTTWAAHRSMRRWVPFEKGGGYSKWFGLQLWAVDWHHDGARIKGTPGPRVQNESDYFQPSWNYSHIARGSLGVRLQEPPSVFGHKGPGCFLLNDEDAHLCNSRALSFFARTSSPGLSFEVESILRAPIPQSAPTASRPKWGSSVRTLIQSKRALVSRSMLERSFQTKPVSSSSIRAWAIDTVREVLAESAVLHTLEGQSEHEVFTTFGFNVTDIATITAEVGTPVGWYGLVDGHTNSDALPWPDGYTPSRLPSARVGMPIVATLREALAAGPSGANISDEEEVDDSDEDIEDGLTGKSIPSETFLEALAQRFNVHPISLCSILCVGITTEGWHCPPEEQRLVRDRLTVMILHLLGHQWPQQISTRESLPEWADADGIIPITEGTHEATLLTRMRTRLTADFSESTLPEIERDIKELSGQSLEAWIDGGFFRHHVKKDQFRRRPVAWQIQCPAPNNGVFACLVHFHALNADLLPKLRTQYIGPQRTRAETELRGLEALPKDRLTDIQQARISILEQQIAALRKLDEDLGKVIGRGFYTHEIATHAIDDAAESYLAQLLDALARRLDATLPAGPLELSAAAYLRAVDEAAARARKDITGTLLPTGGDPLSSLPSVVSFEEFRADLRRDLESLGRGLPNAFQELLTLERDRVKSIEAQAEKLAEADPTTARFAELLDPTRTRPSFPLEDAEKLASGDHAALVAVERVLSTHKAALQAVVHTHLHTRLKTIIAERCAAAFTNIPRRSFSVKKKRDVDVHEAETHAVARAWLSAAWDHVLALANGFARHDEHAAPGPDRPAPRDLLAFIRQEQAYTPDLNDGVRVNIAPLQIAGLLPAEVLPAKDLEKALKDRARWRSDERRWCRSGRLPCPGWWPEGVSNR